MISEPRGERMRAGIAATLSAVAILVLPAPVRAQGTATPKVAVRVAANPGTYANLPLLMAFDRGYFGDESLDVQIKKISTSSATQMPLVARGDIDIAPMVAGPGLFNQETQGFKIKVIASLDETHPGWNDGTWLMVRQDVMDSGAVKSLKDLKGRLVDGGPEGSPVSFLTQQALIKAGLTTADVNFSQRLKSVPDFLTAMRTKIVEVLSAPEPLASQMELQGLARKLASADTIIPWFQEAFLIASPGFLEKNRPATVGFLKAYLRACREITAAGPSWTDAEVDTMSRWAEMPPSDVRTIKGPAYCGALGAISEDSLNRQQDFWAANGMVPSRVAIAGIVDVTALNEARTALDIK
jgi:NitT/TauT family transport system substrate-binding protein